MALNTSTSTMASVRSGANQSRQLNTTSRSLNRTNSRLNNSRVGNNSRANVSVTSNMGVYNTNVIMSITEGRGKAKGEIGLCYIDLNSPILYLAQFMDNCSFDALRMKCNVCSPIEIIFPVTFVSNNVMIQTLKNYFPDVAFKPFDRRFFNDRKGFEYVRTLCYQNHTWIDIELESKYYSLAACGALIQFLTNNRQVKYAHKSMKIVYQSSLDTLIIDPTTAKILELIINLNDHKSTDTLIGTINRTKTKSGYILLRSNILQPSTSIDLIRHRHNMVDAMAKSLEAFYEFDTILERFGRVDLDQMIVNTIQLPLTTNNNNQFVRLAEKKIEHVLQVKYAISLVDKLKQVFQMSADPIWQNYINELNQPGFGAILELIDQVINSHASYVSVPSYLKLEKCFAIKERFNALLDLARGVYIDCVDDILQLVKSYEEKFKEKFGEIKVANSATKGYYMQIKNPQNDNPHFRMCFPFRDITYGKTYISFTSDNLMKLNSRLNKTIEEIYVQSDKTISKLIQDVRAHISCFYALVEIVSTTDLVFSYTYQSSMAHYVRPQFGSYLEVKNGRHPVLEKISSSVTNSVFMNEDLNFHLITGPNMSGKTTFLKQLALLQIMAQIGSFVPAEWATFVICQKLFTRMGMNDNLQVNSSSFMVEIKELKFILNNLGSNCLILIDELGRGCINRDVVPMCWAVCEALLSSQAFTIFATHFVELTPLAQTYLNVSNYHFSSEIIRDNSISKYPHILLDGPNEERFYGIELARMSGLDEKIVENAKNFAYQIPSEINNPLTQDDRDEEYVDRRAKYLLVAKIVHTASNLGATINLEMLDQLRESFSVIKENIV